MLASRVAHEPHSALKLPGILTSLTGLTGLRFSDMHPWPPALPEGLRWVTAWRLACVANLFCPSEVIIVKADQLVHYMLSLWLLHDLPAVSRVPSSRP